MKTALILTVLLSAALPLVAEEALPLPSPWKHQDIGPAKVPGTAQHAGDVFTLQGTMDLWGTADGCHIVWQPCHGDAELVARVASMENPGGVAHAKAALCIRESLDAGARHVTLCVTASDGTQFLSRDKTDGKTTRFMPDPAAPKADPVPKAQFPCWLKIVRHGNDFSGFESTDGEKWQPTGQIKLDLAPDAVIGLSASSHKPDVLAKAVFDHVSVTVGVR